jgi:hypothetical protein
MDLVTKLTSIATGHLLELIPFVIMLIATSFVLFLLSRSYKSESKIALDTLLVIKSVLSAKLGTKGTLLVDAWVSGLQKIQDGEFSDDDKVDQFVRFLRLAAANEGVTLSDEDVNNIHTIVLSTLDLFIGKKPETIAIAVNKFNAMQAMEAKSLKH